MKTPNEWRERHDLSLQARDLSTQATLNNLWSRFLMDMMDNSPERWQQASPHDLLVEFAEMVLSYSPQDVYDVYNHVRVY